MPINDSIKNGKVKPFSSQVNSTTHESSIAFNSSGNKVYFTQHVSDSGGTYSRLKIFYLEKHKDRWQNPHTFVFNDSTSSFAHPFITPDENMFFFVSDMKDGMGGSDIYFCMLKDSLWSAPINMGPPINTPGNEIFPFYDAENKTLYFASDYHPGLGGYDIFEAVEDGESFKIHNMKPPINSSYDDFGIVWISKYRQLGYLVSNRPGGKGLEDIYKIFRK